MKSVNKSIKSAAAVAAGLFLAAMPQAFAQAATAAAPPHHHVIRYVVVAVVVIAVIALFAMRARNAKRAGA